MSPSTQDNLGRRRFFLHRDKAVEDALVRIRHGAGDDWETVPAGDLAALRTALSEVWMHIPRELWSRFCFSTVTRKDILRLAELGRDITARHHISAETKEEIEAILLSCGIDRPA